MPVNSWSHCIPLSGSALHHFVIQTGECGGRFDRLTAAGQAALDARRESGKEFVAAINRASEALYA
jgi:hypothetical protein